jgi:phage antirepressor YoqD-like protein
MAKRSGNVSPVDKGRRVYEVAKDLEMKAGELTRYLQEIGVQIKTPSSVLEPIFAEVVHDLIDQRGLKDLAVAEPD